MNTIDRVSICLVVYMICFARLAYSDSCAVNFRGTSSVRLSAEAVGTIGGSIGNYSVDYTLHTFDLRLHPNQFVSDEQTVFQTGQISTPQGTSWAVEMKIKLTIWQKGTSKPSSSVLYVDVWTMSAEEPVWSKTRHYIILAEDSYPWLHVTFSLADRDAISINGKNRRMDQYAILTSSELHPQENLAIGSQFKGSVADVKVWKTTPVSQVDVESSECASQLGSNMLIYFPFNECNGETFYGYINGEGVCAMMYGSYDTNTLWTLDSPAVDSCKSSLGQCAGATRVSENTPNQNKQGNSLWVPVSFVGAYKVIVPLLVVLAVIAFLRGNRRPQTNHDSGTSQV